MTVEQKYKINSINPYDFERIVLTDPILQSVGYCVNNFERYVNNVTTAKYPQLFYFLAKADNLGQVIPESTIHDALGFNPGKIREGKKNVNKLLSEISQKGHIPISLFVYSFYKRGLVLLPKLELGKYYNIPIIDTSLVGFEELSPDQVEARKRVNTVIRTSSEGGVLKKAISPLEELVLDRFLSEKNRTVDYRMILEIVHGDEAIKLLEIAEQRRLPQASGAKGLYSKPDYRARILNRPRDIIRKIKLGLADIGISFEVEHHSAENASEKAYRLVKIKVGIDE